MTLYDNNGIVQGTGDMYNIFPLPHASADGQLFVWEEEGEIKSNALFFSAGLLFKLQ